MSDLTLKEILIELIGTYGYSQEEISRLTGVNKTRLSKLRTGSIKTMMWEDGRRLHALHYWLTQSKVANAAKSEAEN